MNYQFGLRTYQHPCSVKIIASWVHQQRSPMSAVPHFTLNSPHTAYLINPRGCLLQWSLSCALVKLFVLFVSLKSVYLLDCVAQYNANPADRHVMSPEAYCQATTLSRSLCPCMFSGESHWLGITLLLLGYGWRGSSVPVWRHGIKIYFKHLQSVKVTSVRNVTPFLLARDEYTVCQLIIYVFLLYVFYCYVYVFLLYVYVSSSCQLAFFGYPDWGFTVLFTQL